MSSHEPTTGKEDRSNNNPKSTTHTTVLGMDGSDLIDASSSAQAAREAAPATTSTTPTKNTPRDRVTSKKGLSRRNDNTPTSPPQQPASSLGSPSSTKPSATWLGGLLWKGQETNVNSDSGVTRARYATLQTPTNMGSGTNSRASKRRGLEQPPQGEHASSTRASSLGGASSQTTTATTVEDQLKQDCSFFYQGMEDRGDNGTSTTNNTTTTLSLDRLPRVLTSSQAAAFHAKYHQLNAKKVVLLPEDNDEEHDLFLDEEQGETSPAPRRRTFQAPSLSGGGIPRLGLLPEEEEGMLRCLPDRNVVDGHTTSSLFYEQDGRLLMRLPRDQVRLIMDHNLEAGIVSVEQWREEEPRDGAMFSPSATSFTGGSATTTATAPATGNNGGNTRASATASKKTPSEGPPLRYVLTVSDDLYQRVVAEISHHVDPPYWGLFKCCNEHDERADIRLAVAILLVTLSLLFVTTLEYHED